MKVKLLDYRTFTTTKENQPLLDKNGRPYTRISIKTDQHGTQWLSGLAYEDSPMMKWKAGDEVEIDIVQNGQYLNFSIPKVVRTDYAVMQELRIMNRKLDEIIGMLTEPMPPDGGPGGTDVQKDDMPPDMPF